MSIVGLGGWDERIVTGEKPRKRKVPAQKPGRSEQVVCTPPEFLTAVKRRLGIDDFDIDLAADHSNAVTAAFYDEEANSLIQNWKVGNGWNWCNPPYSDIKPWVYKAWCEALSRKAKTAMLVPASVGANWWAEWVHNKAYVWFLNGRITFVGHPTPYPKDLSLLLYSYSHIGGCGVWPWKGE